MYNFHLIRPLSLSKGHDASKDAVQSVSFWNLALLRPRLWGKGSVIDCHWISPLVTWYRSNIWLDDSIWDRIKYRTTGCLFFHSCGNCLSAEMPSVFLIVLLRIICIICYLITFWMCQYHGFYIYKYWYGGLKGAVTCHHVWYDWLLQAVLEICPLRHLRCACPPRRVTDRWATFATVPWGGW